MVVIETPIFTKRIQELITDDEYRLLQTHLVNRPDVGQIIPGSGGLRKLRWSAGGMEKEAASEVFIIGSFLRTLFFFFMPIRRMGRTI